MAKLSSHGLAFMTRHILTIVSSLGLTRTRSIKLTVVLSQPASNATSLVKHLAPPACSERRAGTLSRHLKGYEGIFLWVNMNGNMIVVVLNIFLRNTFIHYRYVAGMVSASAGLAGKRCGIW